MPTKFVIVSQPRCGTNMLRSMLNQHPDICCLSEVAHPTDQPFAGKSLFEKANIPKSITAKKLLKKHVWKGRPEKAVGFVLHTHQARRAEDAYAGLWDLLAKAPDVKVIFLFRKSKIKQYASLEVAKQTHEWVNLQNSQLSSVVIDPHPDEVVSQLKAFQADQVYAACKLSSLEDYSTFYEDLDAETVMSIQHFLGVNSRELEPQTKKRESRELSEIFSNWDEVSQAMHEELVAAY